MPTARTDDVALYYETAGSGEPVVFVEDVGFGAWMWGWQHAALAGPFRTAVWDLRGTGRSGSVADPNASGKSAGDPASAGGIEGNDGSERGNDGRPADSGAAPDADGRVRDRPTPSGPYAIEDLASDLEAVCVAAGIDRAHLVGSGLGGLIALEYALAFGRVASLTLLGTPATGERIDPPGPIDRDDERALRESLRAVFSPEFVREQPEVIDGIVEWRRVDDADEDGWRAQAAALEGVDLRERLVEIRVPALVLHGTADRVVPVEAGETLARGLPRGEERTFEGAGHLVGIERSRPVNDALSGFLEDVSG